jgi:hypothetical protein
MVRPLCLSAYRAAIVSSSGRPESCLALRNAEDRAARSLTVTTGVCDRSGLTLEQVSS